MCHCNKHKHERKQNTRKSMAGCQKDWWESNNAGRLYKDTINHNIPDDIKIKQCTVQKPIVQCSLYNRSDNNIFNLLINSLSEVIFLSDNGKLFHKQAALNLTSRLPNVVLQLWLYKSFLVLTLYWCTWSLKTK